MMLITKVGGNTMEVTKGAYESIYKHQGYVPVEQTGAAPVAVEPTSPEKSEDELFVEQLVEKPISQWNKEEVKKYAAVMGIDISGTKNANEAKEIIKQTMAAE